jgi:ABC-type antimicrobial peptide transport system permease subunit
MLLWILRRGLATVAVGLGVGVAVAVSAAWSLSAFVTGIWPLDLDALLGAVSLLAIATLAAGLMPAWLAANIDPATALRRE